MSVCLSLRPLKSKLSRALFLHHSGSHVTMSHQSRHYFVMRRSYSILRLVIHTFTLPVQTLFGLPSCTTVCFIKFGFRIDGNITKIFGYQFSNIQHLPTLMQALCHTQSFLTILLTLSYLSDAEGLQTSSLDLADLGNHLHQLLVLVHIK